MTMVWRVPLLALLLVLAGIGPALTQEDLIGIASVIDGDTIEIHGQRIRLQTASMRPKAASFARAHRANTGVGGSRQALCCPIGSDAQPLAASPAIRTVTVASSPVLC